MNFLRKNKEDSSLKPVALNYLRCFFVAPANTIAMWYCRATPNGNRAGVAPLYIAFQLFYH